MKSYFLALLLVPCTLGTTEDPPRLTEGLVLPLQGELSTGSSYHEHRWEGSNPTAELLKHITALSTRVTALTDQISELSDANLVLVRQARDGGILIYIYLKSVLTLIFKFNRF